MFRYVSISLLLFQVCLIGATTVPLAKSYNISFDSPRNQVFNVSKTRNNHLKQVIIADDDGTNVTLRNISGENTQNNPPLDSVENNQYDSMKENDNEIIGEIELEATPMKSKKKICRGHCDFICM
eukprot:Tbor_TRINITY_DN4800_c0_g1::TRINITY_DN4800_c0_g1_i1::g.1418::m.1418